MTEQTTDWPDPEQPGVPLHPKRDGWHWISTSGGPSPRFWHARQQMWQGEEWDWPYDMAERRSYLAPVPGPRWVWRDETFAQLMLGRIKMAQVSKATATDNCFYSLFYARPGERPGYSAPTQTEAMAACEAHAWRVLADAE